MLNNTHKKRAPSERRTLYNRNWHRKRHQEHPNHRIASNHRRAVNGFLQGRNKWTKHLTDILGCGEAEYMAHLERLFQPGMTWANRGRDGWHIDHIKPVSSFDLTDDAQRRAAFHYSNTQPLWALQNKVKYSKH